MRRKRRKNKYIKSVFISSFLLLSVLTIGYSAFQTNISLRAKGNVKDCHVGTVWKYDFEPFGQEFKVPCAGAYKIELWGAEGGGRHRDKIGGKGSYVSGTVELDINKMLYIYVGEYPEYISSNCLASNENFSFNCSLRGSCVGGGGATDVRLVKTDNWSDFISLKSRIIVAAGGGGALYSGTGGSGGGLQGYDGVGTDGNGNHYVGTGGTQNGDSFGKVSSKYTTHGGGGYYAGGVGSGGNAGGGSSFISGHNGCDAIAEESTEDSIVHTGQCIHYSDLYFTDTVMIDGDGYKWTNVKLDDKVVGMPTHDGEDTMIGNEGDGYAKITLVSHKIE